MAYLNTCCFSTGVSASERNANFMMQSSRQLTEALTSMRNLFFPNMKARGSFPFYYQLESYSSARGVCGSFASTLSYACDKSDTSVYTGQQTAATSGGESERTHSSLP